jgi:hypothetical protein
VILEKFLTSRTEYYGLWTLAFLAVYGAAILLLDIPDVIWAAVPAVLLLKDLYDEIRIRDGKESVAYADIEHNPSNIVMLLFMASGFLSLEGTVSGIGLQPAAAVLATLDLLVDGRQDFLVEGR